jgi:hypothetical protein
MKQVSDELELDISEEPLEQPSVSELDEECLLNVMGGKNCGTLAKQAVVVGAAMTVGCVATVNAINQINKQWNGTSNWLSPFHTQGTSAPTQQVTYNINATNQAAVTVP